MSNSKYYSLHKTLFPILPKNIDLLSYVFLNNLSTNIDLDEHIKGESKRLYSDLDTPENLNKLLSSNYMFYF